MSDIETVQGMQTSDSHLCSFTLKWPFMLFGGNADVMGSHSRGAQAV